MIYNPIQPKNGKKMNRAKEIKKNLFTEYIGNWLGNPFKKQYNNIVYSTNWVSYVNICNN